MKILYGADFHLRASTPSCRKDSDFYKTQLDKLRQVVKIARDENVDYILNGGDFFDSHDPTNRLMHDTMAILNQSEAHIIVNPGNHDIFGANTATLYRSGLGILWQAGLIESYSGRTDTWLGDGVIVRFLPYSLSITEDDYNFKNKSTGVVHIIVNHDMLVTHFVPYPHKLVSELKTNADVVLCSHWHAQFLERPGKGDTLFLNPGPLSRQTTHEAKIEPSVAILDIGPGSFSASLVRLDVRPSSEVIDLTKPDSEDKEGLAEQFLDALRQTSVKTLDRQQLIQSVGEQNKFPTEVIRNGLERVQETEKTMETA